ncbi:MAG TPA: hypothetical protein VM925_02370 [Labilithrix sp.]|nr:hypothetical protein [Labilithrix sp.]
MKHDPRLSRRALLKAAAAASGAAAGARILGPFVPEAAAATEPSHFVHILFNGGLNQLFAGWAGEYVSSGAFQVTGGNIREIGDGVVTDKDTFGTFPDIALQHWAGIGFMRGPDHTNTGNPNGGGELSIFRDDGINMSAKLAHAMGGDSAFKSVYFGDYPPSQRDLAPFEGITNQPIVDLKDVLGTVGAKPPPPNASNRGLGANAVETALRMSKRQIDTNPGRLAQLVGAYNSATEALRKPLPATPPLTLPDLDAAYELGGKTTHTKESAPNGLAWRVRLAGAELMIRGAGSNVVNIADHKIQSWDFHQTDTGTEKVGNSINGSLSRRAFLGTMSFDGGKGDRIKPLRTFLDRMLNLPDRNVVVCISGELARTLNGDHSPGTVCAFFGKYLKRGLMYGCDSQVRFRGDTPGVKAFWAAAAAATKVQGSPFGVNPYSKLIA